LDDGAAPSLQRIPLVAATSKPEEVDALDLTLLVATFSTDIALLLGIAVGGSIGGAVMNQSLAGLSAESDSWLRKKNWLPPQDQPPNPRLSDLIMTGGTLDIYRFQIGVLRTALKLPTV
jgi:hypothetical protein